MAHQIPNAILSQINEHSQGGYILVAADEENNLRLYYSFDDALYSRALVEYTRNITEGMYDLTKSQDMESYFDSESESSEEETLLDEDDENWRTEDDENGPTV